MFHIRKERKQFLHQPTPTSTKEITTFIIPTIGRPELDRAIKSLGSHPYVLGFDTKEEGAGETRNKLIIEAKTPWISFLDDDDTIYPDYVEKLEEEIAAHPEADIIHFREYFPWGQFLPAWPSVEWGNIGISFSVKREIALKHPFKSEPFEDYEFVKRLVDMGYKIHFSKYLTYRARH